MEIIVGPMGHPDLPFHWSWCYFHGKAEDLNGDFIDRCIDEKVMDWEAPDLIGANVPLHMVSDASMKRVRHISDTDNSMVAKIWSADASYKWDQNIEASEIVIRRRGLIVCIDDDEAFDWAEAKRTQKSDDL